MKIECLKEKLVQAVSLVDKVPSRNQSLPILSCALLTADKNTLTINTTNLDVGIKVSVSTKTTETGSIAVPMHILSAFLNSTNEDKKIVLEVVENNLSIKTESSSVIIKAQTAEEFPVIPTVVSDKKIKINPRAFVKGLKSVWYAASTSTIKPELASVFIHAQEDSLVFVSTDSFRLAEKKIKTKDVGDFTQIIIPSKNVGHIIKTLEGLDDDTVIYFDKNQIAFETSTVYLVSRLVEGVFPDYGQIIPKNHVSEALALKNDTVEAFRVSNVFADKFNQVNIKISQKNKLFQITTKNGDIGECVKKIQATVSGDDLDVNFNHRYISDSFQSIDPDSVIFSFTGPNKPLVIRGVQDQTFLYLVMPMNK